MNILFTYYIPSGGMETLARQRSKALSQYGINFHFLYFFEGSGVQNIRDIPTFITNDDKEINEILINGNYDLVIICSDYPFVERLRNLGYTGHIIFEVQGLGDFHTAEKWLTDAVSFIKPNNVSGILYPITPHLVQLIDKLYPDHKKFCFDNCIDTSIFQYKSNEKPALPIIGWVGRLEENKNWRDFLRICSSIVQYSPDIEIWIFEDASLSSQEERRAFTKLIQSLNLSNKLRLFDNIPHEKMAEYYSMIGHSGGFLCSTSKVEGFGYAIVEAMSCRCPVLTTDSDGVKRSIIHNKTGKIYPHNDIQKAVEEANEIMNNTPVRNQIINEAEKLVHSNFSLSVYANHFLNMLNTLK
ncbi:glycosyltransferase family 4 protein [uncultured Metabacillus sp.]|uniref:glycosyltransferase family 4 protein n=1 Tax=uncultured Metabacillus sp. TaxID=2860135 RepID=UPI0026075571|nr:glycosyltransferase family 4 protein [uncultured Metabacillus sp.]